MILSAILTLAALGLLAGLGLGIAAKVFAVEVDPRIEQIDAVLPQFNCGACGFASCVDYAKAVVGGAESGLCVPGGAGVSEKIAEITGRAASAREKTVAFVFCGGSDSKARKKYLYNGVADCKSAALLAGGDKACGYGCLGLGSCVHVCPTNAIAVEDGLARVTAELCIGCGKCVATCPKGIIKMVPADRAIHVVCSSQDKGPVVRKACDVGCIGCKRCTKAVDNEQITIDGTLAVVDYSKPLLDPSVAESCPTGAIQVVETEYTEPLIVPEKPAAEEQEARA